MWYVRVENGRAWHVYDAPDYQIARLSRRSVSAPDGLYVGFQSLHTLPAAADRELYPGHSAALDSVLEVARKRLSDALSAVSLPVRRGREPSSPLQDVVVRPCGEGTRWTRAEGPTALCVEASNLPAARPFLVPYRSAAPFLRWAQSGPRRVRCGWNGSVMIWEGRDGRFCLRPAYDSAAFVEGAGAWVDEQLKAQGWLAAEASLTRAELRAAWDEARRKRGDVTLWLRTPPPTAVKVSAAVPRRGFPTALARMFETVQASLWVENTHQRRLLLRAQGDGLAVSAAVVLNVEEPPLWQ